MKKLIVLVFLFSVTVLQAQDNKYSIGFEGGAGYCKGTATYDSSNVSVNSDGAIGLYAGATAEIHFSEWISLRTGLAFEQKKFNVAETVSFTFFGTTFTYSYEMKSKFNYLTIPANLTIGIGDKFRVFGGAGPYLSLLVSQKTVIKESGSGMATTTTTTDDKDEFKPIDLGLSFIAGLSIPISDEMDFSFVFRDHLGLMNINSDKTTDASSKFHSMYGLLGISKKF